MIRLAGIVLLFVLPLLGLAAENPSALNALKVLPKEDLKNLARIEAHDGAPVPGRWHFLIHDPNTETGLKEYVVARGELVVSRFVSQFADTLTPVDVIESAALRIDSDQLAQLAMDYAAANNVSIARLSYQLLKQGAAAQPVWRVNGLNQSGQTLGSIVVTATRGKVVSHLGFPIEPKASKEKFEAEAESLLAAHQEEEPQTQTTAEDRDAENSEPARSKVAETGRKKEASGVAKSSSQKKKQTATTSRRRSSGNNEVRERVAEPPPRMIVRKARRPLGSILRDIFRGPNRRMSERE